MINLAIIPCEKNIANSVNEFCEIFKNAKENKLDQFYVVQNEINGATLLFSDKKLKGDEPKYLVNLYFEHDELFKNNTLDILIDKYHLINIY